MTHISMLCFLLLAWVQSAFKNCVSICVSECNFLPQPYFLICCTWFLDAKEGFPMVAFHQGKKRAKMMFQQFILLATDIFANMC